MKRILQLFPNGVIIWPWNTAEREHKVFTNKEFNSKIANVRRDISSLEDVKVKIFNNNISDSTEEINTNL